MDSVDNVCLIDSSLCLTFPFYLTSIKDDSMNQLPIISNLIKSILNNFLNTTCVRTIPNIDTIVSLSYGMM